MDATLLLWIGLIGVLAIIVLGVVSARTRRNERARLPMPEPINATPATDQAEQMETIRALVADNQLIAAIKLYREVHPGVGLKEAKDAVEALRRGDVPRSTEALPSGAALKRVRRLLAEDRVIEAIRVYRELHPGTNLKDAKQAVDALRTRR